MQGRIYDPEIGRFLSADPFVQFPESTQGFNRYTYVGNNPLSYTDPSGYFLKKLLGGLLFHGDLKQFAPTLIGLAVCAGSAGLGCAVAAGAISGAVGGYMATGTLQGALQGAAMGAASGLIMGGVKIALPGGTFGAIAGRALLSGIGGGLLSKASGGRFSDGFLGGAAGSLASNVAPTGDLTGDTIVGAILGGTVAAIGGGKFANGAVSGAFAAAVRYNSVNYPPGRGLTEGETDMLREVYGDSINYDRVRISRDGFITGMMDRQGIVTGNTVSVSGDIYYDDFSTASVDMQAFLVHEVGHVWQYQNVSSLTAVKAALEHLGGDPYKYALDGRSFNQYGFEQQGAILSGFYRHSQLLPVTSPVVQQYSNLVYGRGGITPY